MFDIDMAFLLMFFCIHLVCVDNYDITYYIYKDVHVVYDYTDTFILYIQYTVYILYHIYFVVYNTFIRFTWF